MMALATIREPILTVLARLCFVFGFMFRVSCPSPVWLRASFLYSMGIVVGLAGHGCNAYYLVPGSLVQTQLPGFALMLRV